MAEWLESGESLRGFARRHGHSVQQLTYWSRRLAEEAEPARAPGPEVTFTPVRLLEAAGGRVEVTLVSGDRVVVDGVVTPEILAAVVTALRTRC